jgi:hypothetical protein
MARPKVGDVAWFVEWCHDLVFEGEDIYRDECKSTRRRVATEDEAMRLAREVWPVAEKTLGVVEVWEAEFTPYDLDDADLYPGAGYWRPTRDESIWFDED